MLGIAVAGVTAMVDGVEATTAEVGVMVLADLLSALVSALWQLVLIMVTGMVAMVVTIHIMVAATMAMVILTIMVGNTLEYLI